MKNILILLLVLVNLNASKARNDHEDGHHGHNEISISNAMFYNVDEESLSYGLHLHGVKSLSEDFGFGLGYEVIFDEHLHQIIDLFVRYNLNDVFSVSIGPGLVFPTEENDDYTYALHLEAEAGFELWDLHIGPAIGYGIGNHDSHFSLDCILDMDFKTFI